MLNYLKFLWNLIGVILDPIHLVTFQVHEACDFLRYLRILFSLFGTKIFNLEYIHNISVCLVVFVRVCADVSVMFVCACVYISRSMMDDI